jgi:RecB family endonuclease NucS
MDPRLSSLSILRFAQGTNFPVSDDEWARLQELLGVAEVVMLDIPDPGLDVAEIHLRQALARNLSQVESGLEPFFPERYEEYPVPGGRIDLLCKDVGGVPVVVELKRNHWDADKAVGQVARYMGWAKEAISDDGNVRGILLVLDEAIHDKKLETAVKVIPGLELKRYSIAFKVQ